jgi:hypothetical protein
MTRKAHGQTDPNKPGNRPKELVEGTIVGKAIGRDKTVVPPDQVYELAAIGCDDREISRFFGVKEDTLRYNFADELTKGREYVKIRLRRAMFRNACDLNSAAVQIFLAKNILAMSDQGGTSNEDPLPWVESVDENLGEDHYDDASQ